MNPVEYSVYISTSLDPYLNLSIENWIYHSLTPQQKVLFLYRNRKSVVIGRFQNPWLECNVETLLHENVSIVRRQSGGGTVYHDPGNTNYSFIAPADLYDIDENYGILLKALRKLGVTAQRTDRNDLYLSGKKFSGSAFKKTAEKVIHHGTLLHHGDTKEMHRYLSGTAKFSDVKGIRSVRSPVVNLSAAFPGITHELLFEALCSEYQRAAKFAGIFSGITYLGEEEMFGNREIADSCREYKSWDWMFGKTPPFAQNLLWEKEELRLSAYLHTRHCRIENVRFEQNPVVGYFIDLRDLFTLLQGIPYRRKDIAEQLNLFQSGQQIDRAFFDSFREWFLSCIYPS